MTRRLTKGERLEYVLDFMLALVTMVLGAVLVTGLIWCWQNGYGWITLATALMAGIIVSLATYVETGSDVY